MRTALTRRRRDAERSAMLTANSPYFRRRLRYVGFLPLVFTVLASGCNGIPASQANPLKSPSSLGASTSLSGPNPCGAPTFVPLQDDGQAVAADPLASKKLSKKSGSETDLALTSSTAPSWELDGLELLLTTTSQAPTPNASAERQKPVRSQKGDMRRDDGSVHAAFVWKDNNGRPLPRGQYELTAHGTYHYTGAVAGCPDSSSTSFTLPVVLD